jgi:IS5 family transposase
VQAAMEFVAGDFGVRRIRNRFDLRSHDLRQRLIHRTAGGK